jgi:hypothetical protein
MLSAETLGLAMVQAYHRRRVLACTPPLVSAAYRSYFELLAQKLINGPTFNSDMTIELTLPDFGFEPLSRLAKIQTGHADILARLRS